MYPEEGKKPCWNCYDDDEDYSEEPQNVGTLIEPECGDGCCWNRNRCEVCGGTGYAPTYP